jgi:hypothetical protein
MVSRSDKREVFRVTEPYLRGVNIRKIGSDMSVSRMLKIKCEQLCRMST